MLCCLKIWFCLYCATGIEQGIIDNNNAEIQNQIARAAVTISNAAQALTGKLTNCL